MSGIPVSKSTSRLWNTVKIILALVLVGFVLSRADFDQLRSLLEHISVPWLTGYIVLFLSMTLLKAMQYYYLNGEGVAFSSVLNVVVMQNVVTNYFASSAGIASYLVLFRTEHGVKVSRSAVVFMLTKIGDLIVLWVALCISSLLVWHSVEVFHNFILVLVAGIGLTLLVFFLTVLFRQRFFFLIGEAMHVLHLSKISLIQKGMDILKAVSDTETAMMVRLMLKAMLLSLIYFLFSITWIYVSYRVFNFSLNPNAVVFVSIIMQLVSFVPVQIFGGLGVTEAGLLYFWSPFQVSQPELASVLIGNRVIFYLVNLLPLIYLPIYTAILHSKDELSS